MAKTQLREMDAAGVFGATVCCAIWGGNAVAGKYCIGPEALPPLGGAALRFAISLPVVALVCLQGGGRLWPRREAGNGWLLLLHGALTALQIGTFNLGTSLSEAGRSSIFISIHSLIVAPLAWLILRERLGMRGLIGLGAATLGIAIILGRQLMVGGGGGLVGDLVVMGSATIFAVQTIAQKLTFPRIPARTLLFSQSVVALIVAGGWSACFEGPSRFHFTSDAVRGVVYQGLASSGVCFSLWLILLSHYPATRLATISFLTPFFGISLGTIMRGEPITWQLAVGGGLVGLGIYLVAASKSGAARESERDRATSRRLLSLDPERSVRRIDGQPSLPSAILDENPPDRINQGRTPAMRSDLRRREFLRSASALGLFGGLGSSWLPRAGGAEPAVGPDSVRFRPEIEPVVRFIEETPRDRIIVEAVARLKAGLSYRDLLSGLFLAGIRDIKPRPVGFKFHAVLVINSAHLLAQAAEPDERLLPLLWALDNFKGSQAQDEKEGDWTLGAVDEGKVPPPHLASGAFDRAMETWDADAADVAVAGLCRSSGASGVMEPFWRFAVRDQRNIGHKAIFAAQSWRTLQVIGWPHAEPVLRSLAFGMLDLQGDAQPIPVGPYDANRDNARKIRDDWQVGKPDPGATVALLEAIRQGSPEAASTEALNLLNRGVSPDSLWDAVILAGSELLMRSPGILSLHAVTAANALHFIYGASGDDLTRKLALLQGVGWLPLFRGKPKAGGSIRIDAIEPIPMDSQGDESIAEIFDTISTDRAKAAAKTVGYLARGGSANPIFATARRMIFHKGRDSHDYKYGAAAWEEHQLAHDPRWQAPILAATMFHLPGARTADSPLMKKAREAVAG